MDNQMKKAAVRNACGIVLLCVSGAFLSVYFLGIKSFKVSDALFLVGFIFFSFFASLLLDRYIRKKNVYLIFFILSCELFFRSTLYGRADFYGVTMLGASVSAKELEHFISANVSLVPFASIRCFLELPLFSYDVIINLLGNSLILAPAVLFFLLWQKPDKRVFIKGAVLAFALSLTAELLQLFFMCGFPDVDDLLLNTLGSLVGAALFSLLRKQPLIYK